MTTTEQDPLTELYRQLNAEHSTHRNSLLTKLSHEQKTAASLTVSQPRRLTTHRWWYRSIVAIAATILFVALVPSTQPRDVWAEVAQSVRLQKWIHSIQKDRDGKVINESWESPSGQVTASKTANEIRLTDRRSSLLQVYDRAENTMIQLETNPSEQLESANPFLQLLLGESDDVDFLKVIDRQSKLINVDGKTWDEIRMTVEPFGGTQMVWIVKVDPASRLPQTMRIETLDGTQFLSSDFDYPAEGPLDLKSLGVPEDATVEDRISKDSLNAIQSVMRQKRQQLGPYHLRMSPAAGGLGYEAWRNERKWRQDFHQAHICDGREIWSKAMGTWQKLRTVPPVTHPDELCVLCPDFYYLENLAYPLLSASADFKVTVQSEPKEGPTDCILVERTATTDVGLFTPRKEQYWLDANRGYVLVKRILTDVAANEAKAHQAGRPKHLETTNSDFQKSPTGVWYPTKVTSTGTLSFTGQGPNWTVNVIDQNWLVQAEFNQAIPDSLFDIEAARKR